MSPTARSVLAVSTGLVLVAGTCAVVVHAAGGPPGATVPVPTFTTEPGPPITAVPDGVPQRPDFALAEIARSGPLPTVTPPRSPTPLPPPQPDARIVPAAGAVPGPADVRPAEETGARPTRPDSPPKDSAERSSPRPEDASPKATKGKDNGKEKERKKEKKTENGKDNHRR